MPTFIALPASPARPIKHIEWSLDRPAQINRSAYTGKRTAVANPWHGIWRGRADMVPIIGEANVRLWRAFFAQLKGQTNCFKLPATEGLQQVLGTTNPVISNNANTTVTPASGGAYTVTKSGGVNGAYDASAVSSAGMSGDFTLRVKAAQTNMNFWAGLSTTPTASNDQSGFTLAFFFNSAGSLYVYDSGPVAGPTSYMTSQYWFIQRTGTTLKVYSGASTNIASATLFYTYPSAISSTLYFDSSLWDTGVSFEAFLATGAASVGANAAQGATSLTISNPPALTAGMMATVTLPSGNAQLVVLTADISAGVITFEPPLREAVSIGAAIETANPYCQVALTDSAFRWSVDAGLQYGMSFDFEEVF